MACVDFTFTFFICYRSELLQHVAVPWTSQTVFSVFKPIAANEKMDSSFATEEESSVCQMVITHLIT